MPYFIFIMPPSWLPFVEFDSNFFERGFFSEAGNSEILNPENGVQYLGLKLPCGITAIKNSCLRRQPF